MKRMHSLLFLSLSFIGTVVFGMEGPKKENHKKKINSTYLALSTEKRMEAFVGTTMHELELIEKLGKLVNPNGFKNAIKNLQEESYVYYHLYKKNLKNFTHLDEMIYTIAENPDILKRNYTTPQQFNAYVKSLEDLFKEAFYLCHRKKPIALFSTEENSNLCEKITVSINLSKEILKRFSESLINTVIAAEAEASKLYEEGVARHSQKSYRHLYKELKASLDLALKKSNEAEKKHLQAVNRASTDKNKRSDTEKNTITNLFNEVTNCRTKVNLITKQLIGINPDYGVHVIKEALDNFSKATDQFTTNRCWINLKLGRIPNNVLISILEKYEKNSDIYNYIKKVDNKFKTAHQGLKTNFMETLQNYIVLGISGDPVKETTAKGFLWELAVAGFLVDSHNDSYICMNKEEFNRDNKLVSCFIDHKLKDAYIECKYILCLSDINYENKDQELEKTKKQLLKELHIAQSNNARFILVSKTKISDPLKLWLTEQEIAHICPANCKSSSLGDASLLYSETENIF